MDKKVADQLVSVVEAAGIKRIYAVTGDSLNEVNDAVRRHKTLQWVHVRHEETGAFAASAEAQLNGIACCAGSSGPGHVHLINGLYDAQRSGASVLAIASACSSSEFGTTYFQETDPVKLFADCSCYNQMAVTPVQFARMLPMALQHAIQCKGVAVLGLPGDLAAEKAARSPSASRAVPARSAATPTAAELARLAQWIEEGEKITIYCGIGAAGAHDEVVRLASMLQAPVAYTFKSKMRIQYDNPYEIGLTGLLGLPSAYEAMHGCDLLIMLGTDFPYEDFLPDDCRIVQVDIHPERIGRRAKVGLGLAGDIKATLEALFPLVRQKTDDSFLRHSLKKYEESRHQSDKMNAGGGRENAIAPEYVATIIDRLADDDAIFTVDTGMCCVWGARMLNARPGGRREMLGSFNHGSMANAMPQAIGAALARPGQQVVALCGDGGLSMLLGDLATIVQYKLPVKLIVFNNRALGMVKLEMDVAGLPDWQTDMYDPDFAAVAEAMGMNGYRATEPEQVESVIAAAFAHPGPALVEVLTDPDALAMPPRVQWGQMKGFATAMVKLLAGGRAGEVWDTAKSNMKHIREVF